MYCHLYFFLLSLYLITSHVFRATAMYFSIFISISPTVSLLSFSCSHFPSHIFVFLLSRIIAFLFFLSIPILSNLSRQFLLTVFPEILYTMLFFISHVLFLNPFIQLFTSFHIFSVPFQLFLASSLSNSSLLPKHFNTLTSHNDGPPTKVFILFI